MNLHFFDKLYLHSEAMTSRHQLLVLASILAITVFLQTAVGAEQAVEETADGSQQTAEQTTEPQGQDRPPGGDENRRDRGRRS